MISPIQFIRLTQYANLYAGMDDGRDKYLSIAAFDGGTGILPAFVDVFKKGCILFHWTDGTMYQNTAADGLAPVWAGPLTGLIPALPSGQIFVGDIGGTAVAVTPSGVVVMSNAGVFSIVPGSIVLADLDAGITPSHIIRFAGQPTTVGGAAVETFAVVGAIQTDLAFLQLVNPGTNVVSIVSAEVTAPDVLTVTFSADPGNDAVFNYQIIDPAV